MFDENTEAAEQEAPESEDREEAIAGGPTQDEKQWAMILHLSPLLNFLVPIPFINLIVPLVMWKMKKESDFISHAGKECINFQITTSIAAVVSGILILAVVGFFLLVVLAIAWIVFTVIAALKTNEGQRYSFPYCLRLIK